MTRHLPPYSGDDALCPKCSNVGAQTEWREASRMGVTVLTPECLRRCCNCCDFEWDEAVNPPAPTA